MGLDTNIRSSNCSSFENAHFKSQLASLLPNLFKRGHNADRVVHYFGPLAHQHVREIYECYQKLEPNAGRVYWLVRSWRTLVWYPLQASLVSVHMLKAAPNLSRFVLRLSHMEVVDVKFGSSQPIVADLSSLIKFNVTQQASLYETIYCALSHCGNFNKKLANQLLTDLLSAALLGLRDRLHLERADIEAFHQQWLEAFGLVSVAATIETPHHHLLLNRQVCCQHFRTACGDHCTDCCRLPLEQRIKNCEVISEIQLAEQ